MIYVKSLVFGIGGAIVASILWILTVFVVPLLAPFLLSRISGSAGAGAAGASIGSGSILAAALIGFIGGYYWKFRRVSRHQPG